MVELLIATNNFGKLNEFVTLFGSLPARLVSPADLGLELEVAETGASYDQNARLKAEAFARASGRIAIGDDSGLEVDALGGAPGLYSARYAGPGASDADRRAKLLHELRQVPVPRPARFRCAIAVARPAGQIEIFEGTCEGEISLDERGSNGFGYDPVFFLPDYQRTLAELPAEVKNRISHRGRAAQAARPYLAELIASSASA